MSAQLFVIGLGIGDDADSAWFLGGLAMAPPVYTPAATPLFRLGLSTVVFSNTSTVAVEARAECEWVAAYTGGGGTATVRLDRDSRAASALYIDPDGGSYLSILDDDTGPWRGIVEGIEEDAGQIIVTAVQYQTVLGKRSSSRTGVSRNLPDGAIATLALTETLGGLRGLRMGAAWFEGSMVVPEFAWRGQGILDILNEMQQRSGNEFYIDAGGACWWTGPLAFATAHTTLLIAGGNFHDAIRIVSNMDRLSSVTAISGDERYTAFDGAAAAAGWPGETTISVNGGGYALVAAAQAELLQRSRSTIEIRGSVGPELFAIRERDYVAVVLPWAGFGGRSYICRVLARRKPVTGRMPLTLQVIPPVAGTPFTSGAGARVRPLPRVGRDGRGGSFVQRQRALRAEVTTLRRGG